VCLGRGEGGKRGKREKDHPKRSKRGSRLNKVYCRYPKMILKISHEGLGDPECGGSFESFIFIDCRRALPLKPWV